MRLSIFVCIANTVIGHKTRQLATLGPIANLSWVNTGTVTSSDVFATVSHCCADVEGPHGFKSTNGVYRPLYVYVYAYAYAYAYA